LTSQNERFFEVIIDRVESIYVDPAVMAVSLKVHKMKNSKTRAVFGSVTLFRPMGNDVIFDTVILKKQGGEYRTLPFRLFPTPMCDYLANDVYFYPELAKNSDFPADVMSNCPFKPGKYNYRGVSISLKEAPKEIMPSGEYAFELTRTNITGLKMIDKMRYYITVNNI
jgi:hypothetical protein